MKLILDSSNYLGQTLGCLQPDMIVEARIEDSVSKAVSGKARGVFLQTFQGLQLRQGITLIFEHVLPRGVRLLRAQLADPLEVRVHSHPQNRHFVAASGHVQKRGKEGAREEEMGREAGMEEGKEEGGGGGGRKEREKREERQKVG